MKRLFTMAAILAIFGCGTLVAWAEEPAATANNAAAVTAKAETLTPAQLRVKMHRTLADLIEAQNAENPDQAQIEKLTKELDQVRADIAATGPAFGRGPGMGNGRGAGYGRGQGYGRGPGWGPGPCWNGTGRGPGYGRGAGYGFVDRNNNGVCDFREAPVAQ